MIGALKLMIIVQLFWAFSITLLVATIPAAHIEPVYLFTTAAGTDTLTDIGPELESNLQNQVELPLVNAAALVFYSGNLIVDLVLNFVTAIPQIFTLLLDGVFLLMPNIAADIQTYLKLLVFTIITVMYFLALISFLSNSRVGGSWV